VTNGCHVTGNSPSFAGVPRGPAAAKSSWQLRTHLRSCEVVHAAAESPRSVALLWPNLLWSRVQRIGIRGKTFIFTRGRNTNNGVTLSLSRSIFARWVSRIYFNEWSWKKVPNRDGSLATCGRATSKSFVSFMFKSKQFLSLFVTVDPSLLVLFVEILFLRGPMTLKIIATSRHALAQKHCYPYSTDRKLSPLSVRLNSTNWATDIDSNQF